MYDEIEWNQKITEETDWQQPGDRIQQDPQDLCLEMTLRRRR
jgi:hypothetical protein